MKKRILCILALTLVFSVFASGLSVTVLPVSASGAKDTDDSPFVFLYEDFKIATSKSFTTPEYKPLPGDSTLPLYVRTGGQIRIEDGKLNLVGTRFTIGMPKGHPKTNPSAHPDGRLDLSKPYRITIELTDTGSTGEFSVYIDNNGTSAKDSYHQSKSRVLNINCADLVKYFDNGVAVIKIEPGFGTATSFIQIRTGSDAEVVIKSITVEYL